MSTENTEKAKDLMQSSYMYNLHKISLVKESQVEGREKISRFKQARHSETRADQLKRIEKEEKLRAQKEQEIKELEEVEMEMIDKLKNTQNTQKEAYVKLRKALRVKINRFPNFNPQN